MIKKFLLFLIFYLSIASLSYATHIMCYSNGVKIYDGFGEHIKFGDKLIIFKDKKTKENVLVSADCVIKGFDIQQYRVKRSYHHVKKIRHTASSKRFRISDTQPVL